MIAYKLQHKNREYILYSRHTKKYEYIYLYDEIIYIMARFFYDTVYKRGQNRFNTSAWTMDMQYLSQVGHIPVGICRGFIRDFLTSVMPGRHLLSFDSDSWDIYFETPGKYKYIDIYL